MDAQDYIGAWHLAIVVEERASKQGSKQERNLHYFPFRDTKRDEWFSTDDTERLAPVFTHSEVEDVDKQLASLRDF